MTRRLQRGRWLVALTDDPDNTIEVEVTPADHFRAELEAGKWRIPGVTEAPETTTALWAFCAMRRLGLFTGEWPEFVAQLYAWEPVRDAAGEPVAVDVDPTQADTSASASPSATGSPDTTGSPSPTTD